MPQAYRQLLGTDLFGNSYGYLNGSDEALRSQFSGATEPTSPTPFQCWADTTANRLKMRNAANDGWIDLGDLGQAFLNALPRSGGVMTGGIDMGANTITNLALGSGTAAARQQELDLKAPIAAPQLTGDAQVNQDPAGNNSLIRRSWAEGRYLKLSGGTMTGALVLTGPGTAPLHPTTFDQMRTFVEFNLTTGHRHDGSDARKVRGTDIDSGAASAGLPLRALGSGASGYSKLPPTGLLGHWGRVASNGTVQQAGDGEWSVVRASEGVYDITINSNPLTGPMALAVPCGGSNFSLHAHATINSTTSIRMRIVTGLGAVEDCDFSFLFL
jgi:hypothetical protein